MKNKSYSCQKLSGDMKLCLYIMLYLVYMYMYGHSSVFTLMIYNLLFIGSGFIFLESLSQNGVVTSRVNVSSSITFLANSRGPIAIDSFNLTDDGVALESNEQYQIMFTGSSITGGVNLGPPTTITILDDDG